MRHSTLTRTVEMKFVGDDLNVTTDFKKNKKRTKGSNFLLIKFCELCYVFHHGIQEFHQKYI